MQEINELKIKVKCFERVLMVCEGIKQTAGDIAKSAKPQHYVDSGKLFEKSVMMNSLPEFSLRETRVSDCVDIHNSTNNIPAALLCRIDQPK